MMAPTSAVAGTRGCSRPHPTCCTWKRQRGPVRVGATINSAGVESSRNCSELTEIPTGIADAFDVREVANGGIRCMRSHGQELILENNLDDNFQIVDLGRIARLHREFVGSMPRVRPFYAIKCNPTSGLVRAMAVLGCGFDCATAPEMQAALAAGATPDDIILAHPCKRPVDLRFAANSSVLKMTFDCEDELDKIAEMMPQAELVLRIRADDPTASVSFGMKYGADAQTEAPALLAAAKLRNLNVTGVSFHVGSGSREPVSFRHAIAAARQVFDAAKTVGYHLTLLDIGGGFVGSFDAQGEVLMGGVAEHVNSGLADYFPLADYADVQVIAEPGRYFMEVCATMFSMVHNVKTRPDGRQWYYLTDGAPRTYEFCGCPCLVVTVHFMSTDQYVGISSNNRCLNCTDAKKCEPCMHLWTWRTGLHGSLALVVSGRGCLKANIMRGPMLPPPAEADRAARIRSTTFGPTLDGWDRILEDVPMPVLRRGDWLQLPDHGAYQIVFSNMFNGYATSNARTFYVWSRAAVDNEARALVELHKSTCATQDAAALRVPEELVSLTASPQDLGINVI